MSFEWDKAKAASNEIKHGLSFFIGLEVFRDIRKITILSIRHEEQRRKTIGQCLDGRVIVVIHTEREGRIRIISVRKAKRRERDLYNSDYPR
jgi:uncharacterized DUF497 family protein